MTEDKKRLTLEDFKQKKNDLSQSLEHVNGGQALPVQCHDCVLMCDVLPDCHD